MTPSQIASLIEKAILSRAEYFDSRHESAFRLFNGFTEGHAHLTIDIYAGTALFHNYHPQVQEGLALVQEALTVLKDHPQFAHWLHASVVKHRNSASPQEERGSLLFGSKPDKKIKEHGVWYAVDLTMNRDATFFLDTRNLRQWLAQNMPSKSVLNTFAYTGSLGVAATAGGANLVVQLDRNKAFLNLAKDSYTLNGFPIHKKDFITGDFFPVVSKFKSTGQSFDCVIIDPPFFSATSKGRVDQENDSARLINKIRPLVNHNGYIIAINNALFLSGKAYMQTLDELCQDGYLKIKELLAVPEDVLGLSRVSEQITDPHPFNHSTKMVILEVLRK